MTCSVAATENKCDVRLVLVSSHWGRREIVRQRANSFMHTHRTPILLISQNEGNERDVATEHCTRQDQIRNKSDLGTTRDTTLADVVDLATTSDSLRNLYSAERG